MLWSMWESVWLLMATAVMFLVLVVWRVAAVAIGPHPAEYSDGEGGRRMGTP